MTAPTFAEFFERWHRQMAVEWRPLHSRSVRDVFRAHLLPRFGAMPVDALTRDDVFELRAALRERKGVSGRPLSAGTINKVVVLLGQMLGEAALRHGFVPPTQAIKRMRGEAAEIAPFSLDEVDRLVAQVDPDYRDYLETRFFTGLRTGEINGLKWHNVDLDARVIRVREIHSAGRDELGGKTESAMRDVPMLGPVHATLARRAQRRDPAIAYVFHTKTGRPISAQNFANRVWNPLLARLGLAKRRPYQTRHTTATWLLAAGENPEWIARVMGHANTQMLFTVYSRFVPNLTRRDGSAADALLAARRLPVERCVTATPVDAALESAHVVQEAPWPLD